MENNEKISEILQLVSFTIGSEEYGVDILKVQEINRMTNITHMPNTPDYVDGIIYLRGRVIPVISLRTRLGLSKINYDRNTRIVVVDLHGMTIGFIVDSVSEVLRIPKNITEPPPSITAGINSEYITAIARLEDKLLILLDLEKVLLHTEIEQIQIV